MFDLIITLGFTLKQFPLSSALISRGSLEIEITLPVALMLADIRAIPGLFPSIIPTPVK
ncbi:MULTISPECIES: hypothetical protein [Acidianus]|uniref:hypothetical protein n=1 Tax=Acidianus TaxID=12914 RepID=UPI001F469888|nr:MULTISPECIES: hypothetical protein [Acidianus]